MRLFYLALAALFFALAVLGVFLPLLPTTPFVLLTSWALIRSSPALHARLRRSPVFGPLLVDWERNHGVRLHVKFTAIGAIVVAVTASLVFGHLTPTLRVMLCVLAAVGACVVLRLKTVREPRA